MCGTSETWGPKDQLLVVVTDMIKLGFLKILSLVRS